MNLVGCIRPFADFSFTVPIYLEQDEYYFHEVSNSFKIINFIVVKSVIDVIKLQNNLLYKIDDIAPLVFHQNLNKFIVGPADSTIKLISEFLNEDVSTFHYLNSELIYLNSCIVNSVTKKKKVPAGENDSDNEDENLNYSSELLRALAHPIRLKILKFIDEHESINVDKIYSDFELERSITSQHLKILRIAGILSVEVIGKYHIYQINYEVINKVDFALKRFLNRQLKSERSILNIFSKSKKP